MGGLRLKDLFLSFVDSRQLLGVRLICQAAPGHRILWWILYQEGLSRRSMIHPKELTEGTLGKGVCTERGGAVVGAKKPRRGAEAQL